MTRNLLLPLLLLISGTVHAQFNLNKDSLLHILSQSKKDSSKALLLITIGNQYEGTEPEVAKAYYRKANALSEEIGFLKGRIKFIANYTYVLNMQGKYDSGLLLNLKAITLAREKGDSIEVAKASFNVGTSYRQQGNLEEAAKYYEQGKLLFSRYKNKNIEAQAADILQVLYQSLHQYQRGIESGETAVRLSREVNNKYFLGSALMNLGSNYTAIQNYDKALVCFQESLVLSKELNDQNMEYSNYLNIADIFLQKGQYEKLKPYFDKALELAERLELDEGIAISKKGLSIYYLSQKQNSIAEKYAREALAITYRADLRVQREKILSLLSNISFAMQNMQDGEEYARASILLSDSLMNEANYKNITELEKKYEVKRKDDELKLQAMVIEEKSLYNYILLIAGSALFVITILLYRNYRQKQNIQQQRINELESEKKLMAAEAVLKGEEKERTRLAKDLHDGLGGMLSGIKFSLTRMKGNLIMTPDNALAFERSIDMLNSSIQEMRRVAHNMMPEALVKFGLDTAMSDFCNDINQSGVLQVNYQSIGIKEMPTDQTTGITIYRIVQELLNNVMKHAGAKTAIVQISREGDHISITVEDDGKGFDVRTLDQVTGMGWSNIRIRVAYLKGKMDIQSAPGKGTSVLVEFGEASA